MSDLIVNLTDSTLDDTLKNASVPVLLDLWAPWCGPCLAVAPLLEKVANSTAGHLTVAKLDVEQYEHLMPRFRVRSIPTLLLFRNGSEISRKVGVDSLSDLNSWLRSQGIAVETAEETVLPVSYPWPSFYQDKALFDFLTGRLKAKAHAGEISHYNYPRPEGLTTSPFVMVGQESLDVFERVTALPKTLAKWLECFDYITPSQIDALIDALAIGKDYSTTPLRFVTHWLSNNNIPWQTLLEAPIAKLHQQWLTLANDYLAAKETPRQNWLSLQQQAVEFYQLCQNSRHFEMHLCALLSVLSPPPELNDDQIADVMINHWFECQIYLEKIKAGWSKEEIGMADVRWAWIEARLTEDIPEEKVQKMIDSLRQDWAAEAPEFTIFAQKEVAFFSEYPALVAKINQPFQALFLTLLQQAPDVI
ncbi:thioredoxin family protein [Brenneria uluponensis]|uniref:thioredoxin family protein n=1 Tax=Brenneria uluponensis TaxID=3057057 RepID=UPI0028E5DF34|nr:thioredoxin domain-containing protein [Brenneria ulupoensis]